TARQLVPSLKSYLGYIKYHRTAIRWCKPSCSHHAILYYLIWSVWRKTIYLEIGECIWIVLLCRCCKNTCVWLSGYQIQLSVIVWKCVGLLKVAAKVE